MRRLAWVPAIFAMASLPAWAADGGQEVHAPPAGAGQRVASKSAEVARLEQDVAAEEARSHEADRKMEEQDRAIADLRRQLEQLKGSRAASGKGP